MAQFYSGPALQKQSTNLSGGGVFPTRLAVPSLHFSLAGVNRVLMGLHVSPLDEAPQVEGSGNSGGGIDIASYKLPVLSRDITLEHEAISDIQSVVVAAAAPPVASGPDHGVLVGCADAYGRATLHRVPCPAEPLGQAEMLAKCTAGGSLSVAPPSKRPKTTEAGVVPGLLLAGSECAAGDRATVRPSEWGWSGLGFSRGDQATTVAVAHQTSRSLTFYDTATGACVARCFTAQPPRAVTWLSPQLLGLAETTSLTIWDQRIRHENAQGHGRPEMTASPESQSSVCARRWDIKWRQQPSHRGILNAISPVTMNDQAGSAADYPYTVAVAGDDRMVYVFDARKALRVIKRWRCPCKYDVTSLHESTAAPGILYMSGLDNEFMTCRVGSTSGEKKSLAASGGQIISTDLECADMEDAGTEKVGGHGRLHQTHRLGVRGDSRWIGVSVLQGSVGEDEALVGLCSSGTLAILKTPQHAQHAL